MFRTSCTTGNLLIAGNFHPNEHSPVTLRGQIRDQDRARSRSAGVLEAGPEGSCEHGPVRLRPPPIGLAGAATAAAGLVLVAVGTFLPWFRSGIVLRDSYDTIGVARTLRLDEGSPLKLALDAWTMIIPAITLSVALYAFGLRRTAATIAVVVAIVCGTIGGFAAVVSGSQETSLGIAGTGPTVTLIGGVLALLGAIGIFAGRRTRATNSAGGEP
jgi:hypothetical protein